MTHLPTHIHVQIRLKEIRNRHSADQKLFNEVVELVKNSSFGSQLLFSGSNLVKWREFSSRLENNFNTTHLKPRDVPVKLSNGTARAVSIFEKTFCLF